MKNFQLKSVIAAFLILFTFLTVSCKDDDEKVEPQPENTPAATITFTSTSMHSSFNGSQVVNVAGKIEAQKQIHGYKIIIRNKTANTETILKEDHAHGTAVNFTTDWTSNVTSHSDMEAEVIVTLDHEGNTLSQKVSFHCMP